MVILICKFTHTHREFTHERYYRERKLHRKPFHSYQCDHAASWHLGKSYSKGLMNEIDAKCKKVSIDISDDMKRVVISGDGHGFKSVDDIKSLFGEFGFDHETEGELSRGRRFGRYGIGRGQLFKFGKSTWSTNQLKPPTTHSKNRVAESRY